MAKNYAQQVEEHSNRGNKAPDDLVQRLVQFIDLVYRLRDKQQQWAKAQGDDRKRLLSICKNLERETDRMLKAQDYKFTKERTNQQNLF